MSRVGLYFEAQQTTERAIKQQSWPKARDSPDLYMCHPVSQECMHFSQLIGLGALSLAIVLTIFLVVARY